LLGALNLREQDQATIRALQAENQSLRDEIARLKGEHGGPKSGRNRRPGADGADPTGHSDRTDHSSEQERKPPLRKMWQKGTKAASLEIDRMETCRFLEEVSRGLVFVGYHRTVFQDLVIRRDNVEFLREKYSDPRTGQTFLAPLPPGYVAGTEFGPGLTVSALTLVYESHLTLPAFHRLATGAGVQISRGKIAALVTAGLARFHAEQQEVLRAGLASSPWQQTDVTSTRVNGQSQACHVLLNRSIPSITLRRSRTGRRSWMPCAGGNPRTYRLDAVTHGLLAQWKVARWVRRKLASLPHDYTWDAAGFDRLLAQHLPQLTPDQQRQLGAAAQIAAYRATAPSVVHTLLSDDAGVYDDLTWEHALCWIHDGRHYKKLLPQFAYFQQEVEAFRQDYWAFYRKLLAYREAPSPAVAADLEAEFDTLFGREVTYRGLAECLARTRANKAQLLLVLQHPELPLHNNEAELAARRGVRKRDVSFGPRSPAGVRAWDTLQGLAETTRKLGVRFAAYLNDRIRGLG
jgi:hypothetical protein